MCDAWMVASPDCFIFCRYAWTIANCAICDSNMGWLFTATKKKLLPRQFWGIRSSQVSDDISSGERDGGWGKKKNKRTMFLFFSEVCTSPCINYSLNALSGPYPIKLYVMFIVSLRLSWHQSCTTFVMWEYRCLAEIRRLLFTDTICRFDSGRDIFSLDMPARKKLTLLTFNVYSWTLKFYMAAVGYSLLLILLLILPVIFRHWCLSFVFWGGAFTVCRWSWRCGYCIQVCFRMIHQLCFLSNLFICCFISLVLDLGLGWG